MYAAIVSWDGSGRVSKFQPYDNLTDAEAHAAKVAENFPGAFAAAVPGTNVIGWRVVNGAVVDDPDPVPAAPVVWTAREFMALFTDEELVAIAEAKRTNAQLEIWWAKATAGEVQKDHPGTAAGLAYVVSLGLLTQARADEVLA